MRDRLRAEQALANLVDNALRHGDGAVELVAEPAGDGVRLHVLDRGPGFDPALNGHAFERFTRGDRARSRGGTGLGLAIVDAIARSHGGTAGAAPRDGGGADVWIELPGSNVLSSTTRRTDAMKIKRKHIAVGGARARPDAVGVGAAVAPAPRGTRRSR